MGLSRNKTNRNPAESSRPGRELARGRAVGGFSGGIRQSGSSQIERRRLIVRALARLALSTSWPCIIYHTSGCFIVPDLLRQRQTGDIRIGQRAIRLDAIKPLWQPEDVVAV